MAKRFMIDGVDFTDTLTSTQVARLFTVDPRTVVRWAEAGHLATIRTPGGHRRFSRIQVQALIRESGLRC